MNERTGSKASIKILIVDDCERMRAAIRGVVQSCAGEIHEAADGASAIDLFSLHRPDWVTLDLAMSPMDGLTAAREIRRLNPLARILIVTAHDTPTFREAARLAGAAAYLLKDDLSKIRDAITQESKSQNSFNTSTR